jgi:hypothetical protein
MDLLNRNQEVSAAGGSAFILRRYNTFHCVARQTTLTRLDSLEQTIASLFDNPVPNTGPSSQQTDSPGPVVTSPNSGSSRAGTGEVKGIAE